MKFSTASATKAVTLNGMAELCAKAAGVEPNVINYDPASVPDLEVKKAFPFRPIHFYSSSAKAQAVSRLPRSESKRKQLNITARAGFVGGAQGASRLLQVHRPRQKRNVVRDRRQDSRRDRKVNVVKTVKYYSQRAHDY